MVRANDMRERLLQQGAEPAGGTPEAFEALIQRLADQVSGWFVPLVIVIAIASFAVEMIRMATIHWGALVWTRVWIHMQSFLRANLLAAQLASGGSTCS